MLDNYARADNFRLRYSAHSDVNRLKKTKKCQNVFKIFGSEFLTGTVGSIHSMIYIERNFGHLSIDFLWGHIQRLLGAGCGNCERFSRVTIANSAPRGPRRSHYHTRVNADRRALVARRFRRLAAVLLLQRYLKCFIEFFTYIVPQVNIVNNPKAIQTCKKRGK